MSVFDNSTGPQPSPSEQVAEQLKIRARAMYQQLAHEFNSGSRQFWRNPRATPAEIAAALGADGAEIFRLHGKIGELLSGINSAAVAEGAAIVGQFTYNNDGSITVIEPVA